MCSAPERHTTNAHTIQQAAFEIINANQDQCACALRLDAPQDLMVHPHAAAYGPVNRKDRLDPLANHSDQARDQHNSSSSLSIQVCLMYWWTHALAAYWANNITRVVPTKQKMDDSSTTRTMIPEGAQGISAKLCEALYKSQSRLLAPSLDMIQVCSSDLLSMVQA